MANNQGGFFSPGLAPFPGAGGGAEYSSNPNGNGTGSNNFSSSSSSSSNNNHNPATAYHGNADNLYERSPAESSGGGRNTSVKHIQNHRNEIKQRMAEKHLQHRRQLSQAAMNAARSQSMDPNHDPSGGVNSIYSSNANTTQQSMCSGAGFHAHALSISPHRSSGNSYSLAAIGDGVPSFQLSPHASQAPSHNNNGDGSLVHVSSSSSPPSSSSTTTISVWRSVGMELGLNLGDSAVEAYLLELEEEVRQEELCRLYDDAMEEDSWEEYYRSLTAP